MKNIRLSSISKNLVYAGACTIVLLSCRRTSAPPEFQGESKGSAPPLVAEAFSDLPPEISGCACYFSENEQQFQEARYIYTDDMEKNAFMKIGGTLIKFSRNQSSASTDSKTIVECTSDQYKLKLEMTDAGEGGEGVQKKTGTLTLEGPGGQIVQKEFVGECGC